MRLSKRFLDSALERVLLGLIRVLRILPYRRRVAIMGVFASRFVGPLAGYRRRVRDNLKLVMPDLSQAEADRIYRQSSDNLGRNLAEIFYWPELAERLQDYEPHGDGWDEVKAALDAGKPTIFISGHFGNFNAFRGRVAQMGHRVVGIYLPLEIEGLNTAYVDAMQKIGPVLPRDASGMRAFIKELKAGHSVAILFDQALWNAKPLSFFDQPARTVLTPAELALRFDALLVPSYGTRLEDGVSFDMEFEKPIPHSTPEEMMQKANNSLEARVRDNMGQWLWMHRRWK